MGGWGEIIVLHSPTPPLLHSPTPHSALYFRPRHSRGVRNADKKIRSTARGSAKGESQNNQPPLARVRS
jgi:hypothetical protein